MDLKDLDNQIRAMKELSDNTIKLIETEKKHNETLLRSISSRKKYTDVMLASEEVQNELLEKERGMSSAIRSQKADVLDAIDRYKKLKNAEKELHERNEELRSGEIKNIKQIKENQKKLLALRKETKNTKEEINKYEKTFKNTIKSAKKMKNESVSLRKSFKGLSVIDSEDIGSYEKLDDMTERRIALMKKQHELQVKAKLMTKEEAKFLDDELDTVEGRSKVEDEILKGKASVKGKALIKDIGKRVPEFGTRKRAQEMKAFELKSIRAEAAKTLLSDRTSFGERLKAAASLKEANLQYKELKDVMKLTGKGATGLAGTFRVLGTAISSLGKLGIVGLFIQGVTAIAGAVNKYDKFLKGFNQTFSKLKGPTVMMKDVKGSMREFTDALFNLQRNLKYGIKAEDISGMFQGVAEAGLSLQGVIDRVGNYDKVIEDAAKISLDFGVSIQEAGSMIGEQMSDLKYSIDETSDAFRSMSYDASIAGIQSQKFYQATYAAAEALSYYGKFLDSASVTLKNFQQQGGMGFKDAQQQTQEMTGLFKNMDKNMRVAFIEMSGGVEEYRKDFKNMVTDAEAEMNKHNKNIIAQRKLLKDAKERGATEDIKRLESEIKAEEDQMLNAQKTFAMASQAANANAQDMAMYLEMLSDKTTDKMGEFLKFVREKGGPDIFKGDTRAMVEYMKNVLQVSDEFAMKMIGTVNTSKEGIKRMAHEMKNLIGTLDVSDAREGIGKIISDSLADGQLNLKETREAIEEYAASKDLKIDIDMIMSYLEKMPVAVQEIMQRGTSAVIDNIENITLKGFKGVNIVTGEASDDQAKRLDDIVKNTRTIEDFLGINKEYFDYIISKSSPQVAAAEAAVATARSAASILHFVEKIAKGERAAMTEEEFRKTRAYKDELPDLMAKQILLTDELSKTSKSDIKKRDKIQKEIDKVNKDISSKAGEYLYMTPELDIKAQEKSKGIAAERKKTLDEIHRISKSGSDDAWSIMEKTRAAYNKKYGKIMPIEVKDMDPNKDYKATKGGYALLSKGDVVVNAKNMAAGIGGDIGAFKDRAFSDIMKSRPFDVGGVIQAPTIPVSITIGSVNGNPDEFLKSIKPAIEQAFERMYFDKQKRK